MEDNLVWRAMTTAHAAGHSEFSLNKADAAHPKPKRPYKFFSATAPERLPRDMRRAFPFRRAMLFEEYIRLRHLSRNGNVRTLNPRR